MAKSKRIKSLDQKSILEPMSLKPCLKCGDLWMTTRGRRICPDCTYKNDNNKTSRIDDTSAVPGPDRFLKRAEWNDANH